MRGIEADVLPTCQRHGIGVIPWSPLAGGWLSGKYRKGQDTPSSTRADRLPGRYDLSLPGNQRKFEAADALGALADEVGIPLIEIAIAWVINHPAVTSAIIGPRTMEHLESQLPAASRTLDAELLDRIDEIVPPATSFNYADTGYANPALEPARAQKVMAGAGRPSGRPASLTSVWCSSRHRSAGSLPAPRSARPTGEGSEGIGSS